MRAASGTMSDIISVTPADECLAEAARQGDREAFAELPRAIVP